MRVDGTWVLDAGGVLWPVLTAEVLGAGGSWVECTFLVDTGAESTVLAADTFHQLGLPSRPSPRPLQGVGGTVSSVLVDTVIRFSQADGQPATVRHHFDASLDPQAVEVSLLGRDILGAFAVIVDRPARLLTLVSGRHRYVIQES